MAADTVSSLSGWTVATSVLHYGILKNYFERPGLKSLCTDLGDGAGMGGLTFKTPVWNPVSETFAAHSEAGSITATSQADTSFDITVAQQVLDVQVSDEALWVIDGAGWSNYVEQRAMAFADQADYRLSALIASYFDDFTAGANPEGTAGTALTLETILSARAALQVATGSPGSASLVLHNEQWQDLFNSMRGETLDGIFHPAMASLGRFGAVKGTILTDILVVETGLVAQVSSNHRGALFRPDALCYKHGLPKNLATALPGARTYQVSSGDIEAWMSANGMALPAPEMMNGIASVASSLMQGQGPAIYVESGRQGLLSTRESRLGASFFVGVGGQPSRGVSIRSIDD